ncbi:MAG: helix-turn-helix transcriptional regulator [Oscillospiraceae bacterium]|jgi:transcriptional regulator with XRE-family HTH domain|nr:helix-turn-helix transcriptional regulator [Oscillospiraceae bacterium]
MELKIRSERKKRDWTQEKTAKLLGITQTALQKLETGKRNPSLETLLKSEEVFGMDYRELFNLPQLALGEERQKEPDGNQA